ncbi:hypothetical protein [Piscirickettsia litoralis]|uniref:hypothetical protein n=1 Tax=Piscirickettsia litoralis TaxID=1891921 RepID=UPI001112D527|nr:hypothetical protein [Piscirickettsia litoralis]
MASFISQQSMLTVAAPANTEVIDATISADTTVTETGASGGATIARVVGDFDPVTQTSGATLPFFSRTRYR